MAEKIRNFRQLDIWKKGIEIVKDVYKTVSEFPKHELYGLSAQMQYAQQLNQEA
ncbi:MAG TPA: four helix bundle protein [Sedimentisphaerales bacterium]|nr:four helix bundle protein [Sedimentisphaerales bacterium]